MCMKNVNTDVIFFSDVDTSVESRDKTITIYGANRGIPEIPTVRVDDNTLRIQTLSFMVSINAVERKGSPELPAHDAGDSPDNTIYFSNQYEVCFRITETSSGRFIDLDTIDFVPEENQVVLCRKIYSKKMLCRYHNISVARPPEGKNYCALKVLIRHSGTPSWTVQSMHPIEMKFDGSAV